MIIRMLITVTFSLACDAAAVWQARLFNFPTAWMLAAFAFFLMAFGLGRVASGKW